MKYWTFGNNGGKNKPPVQYLCTVMISVQYQQHTVLNFRSRHYKVILVVLLFFFSKQQTIFSSMVTSLKRFTFIYANEALSVVWLVNFYKSVAKKHYREERPRMKSVFKERYKMYVMSMTYPIVIAVCLFHKWAAQYRHSAGTITGHLRWGGAARWRNG